MIGTEQGKERGPEGRELYGMMGKKVKDREEMGRVGRRREEGEGSVA